MISELGKVCKYSVTEERCFVETYQNAKELGDRDSLKSGNVSIGSSCPGLYGKMYYQEPAWLVLCWYTHISCL